MGKLQSLLNRRDGGVVVNATTLGWKNSDTVPIDSFPESGWTFFDLNYCPEWPWRDSLVAGGVRVITGEKMLLYQAASSFRLWTGREPDLEAGSQAIEAARLEGAG
jgi:shikimate 5-dehydrogenase